MTLIATDARVVTKSDTVKLPGPNGNADQQPKAIYVGGTGHLNVKFREGEATVLISAIPVGTILPISPEYVMSASTTATLIVALY